MSVNFKQANRTYIDNACRLLSVQRRPQVEGFSWASSQKHISLWQAPHPGLGS